MAQLGPLSKAIRRAQSHERVVLDFSSFNEMYLNEAVLIGGLITSIRSRGGAVELRALNPDVSKFFTRLGILPLGGRTGGSPPQGAIPFQHNPIQDQKAILAYLEGRWLGTNAISMSDRLRGQILGTVWETYANAFEHANSAIGVVAAGSFHRNRVNPRLTLSVLDLGEGIPTKVRRHFNNRPLAASRALQWAFEEGTTTGSGPRGLGLSILKDFLKVNNGMLRVLSNDGYVIFKDGKESFRTLTWNFPGTLINIVIEADGQHYCFKDEVNG